MSNQVSHHPDLGLLKEFYEGTLAVGFSMAISAHVDDCAACRECVAEIAESICNDWYDDHASIDTNDKEFAGILDDIVSQPASGTNIPNEETSAPEAPLRTVQLKGRTIKLPHVLQQFIATGFRWKEIGKGIHQALIDADPATKCEIILMEPGARVPRHTHMGKEFMLVLDGSISDGNCNYGVADFVVSDQQIHHGQLTTDGCICLFITDAPLKFTEGFAQLLNPINRAKFWWAGRRGSANQ